MKYLVNFKKELVITLGVFVTVALVLAWAVVAIIHNDFSYDNAVALIAVLFEVLGWYYNMPTSEENAIFTDGMRVAKTESDDSAEELPFDYFEEGDENDEN